MERRLEFCRKEAFCGDNLKWHHTFLFIALFCVIQIKYKRTLLQKWKNSPRNPRHSLRDVVRIILDWRTSTSVEPDWILIPLSLNEKKRLYFKLISCILVCNVVFGWNQKIMNQMVQLLQTATLGPEHLEFQGLRASRVCSSSMKDTTKPRPKKKKQ